VQQASAACGHHPDDLCLLLPACCPTRSAPVDTPVCNADVSSFPAPHAADTVSSTWVCTVTCVARVSSCFGYVSIFGLMFVGLVHQAVQAAALCSEPCGPVCHGRTHVVLVVVR
jgi:hypothetical protein